MHPAGYPKPVEQSDMVARKKFIEEKYVQRRFAAEGDPPSIEAFIASGAAAAASQQPTNPLAAIAAASAAAAAPAPQAQPQPAASMPVSASFSSQPAPSPPPAPAAQVAEMVDLLNLGGADPAPAPPPAAASGSSSFQLADDDWGDFASATGGGGGAGDGFSSFAAAPTSQAASASASSARPSASASQSAFAGADLLGMDFGPSSGGLDPLADLMSLTVSHAAPEGAQGGGAGMFGSAFPASSAFPPAAAAADGHGHGHGAHGGGAHDQGPLDPFASLLSAGSARS